MLNQRSINTLNELISIGRDSVRIFSTAAENLKDEAIAARLQAFAEKHKEFAEELDTLATDNGVSGKRSGSVMGAAQNRWLNIKASLKKGDEATILGVCVRGEDRALKAYERALGGDLPASIRRVIQRQYSAVNNALNDVRDLHSLLVSPDGPPPVEG